MPLHVACTQDNENIVKELVRRNALDQGSRRAKDDLAAIDAYFNTPLQIACLHNKVRVVRYLTQEVGELVPCLDVQDSVNYSADELGEFNSGAAATLFRLFI